MDYGATIAMTLVIMTMFLALVVCSVIFTLQYKNRRNLIGKRLATILTPSGDRIDKLLSVNFNELLDRDPITHEDIIYFVRPDKAFKTAWPFNRPKILQVEINSFLYTERNPEPLDPFLRPTVMDGLVLGNLKNISFSRAMVGRSEEIVEAQMGGQPRKRKVPAAWLIAAGIALLVLIGIAGYMGTT